MISYYRKQTPGQMVGKLSRLSSGLNEYAPPVAITDNHLSDVLDVKSYRDEVLIMDVEQTLSSGIFHEDSDLDGMVMEASAIQGVDEYALLVYNKSDYDWHIRHAKVSDLSITNYAIPRGNLPKTSLFDNGDFSDGFTTPWDSTNAGTPIISSGMCKFTVTAQNGGIHILVPVVSGRKYYISAKLDNVESQKINLNGTLTYDGGVEFFSVQTMLTGVCIQNYIYSPAGTDTLVLGIHDSRVDTWTEVTVYYLNIVDVTDETGDDTTIKAKYDALEYISYITTMEQYNYSSCNFTTQSKRYVVFTCEYNKELIYFDYLNSVVGNIALPFYPKKIVSHANRIFAIDIYNNIWWCRAGDIYSWYGIEYDDDYLMASANMSLTPYTLTAQPDVCRPITATVAVKATTDTLGTLTVVGVGSLGQVQSEILTPIANARVQTVLSYATITSITSIGWSASSTADTIKFGVAPVSSGYVQLDSGYWTIEREKTLSNLCVLSDNLYIFAEDNIYVLKGYSYDTFSLSQAVANIGLKTNTIPRRWLTTISNLAYFYMNGDIYEFNGYDYPKLITHSIHINGQLSNGVLGGIETLNTNYALASDTDNLYVYDARTYLFDTNYYYLFDTNVRTWWKKSGFTKHNTVYTSTAFNVLYVTKYNTDSIVSFVSVNSAEGSFDMHTELGHKGLLNPYLITKAYNTNPSELGTLTNIILEVVGDSSTQTDIILYYSKSVEGNDFIEFKRYSHYIFTEDIEILDIPVPVSYIVNTHHYRLKIEIDGYMEIYNIERRFRVRGRSR